MDIGLVKVPLLINNISSDQADIIKKLSFSDLKGLRKLPQWLNTFGYEETFLINEVLRTQRKVY